LLVSEKYTLIEFCFTWQKQFESVKIGKKNYNLCNRLHILNCGSKESIRFCLYLEINAFR
jgi:hypothetical protein